MTGRQLARRLWVGGPDGERGAVAVAMALLVPLLLAAAALAVDSAAQWMARNQVITGADSAALAQAMDCAVNNCGSTDTVKAKISYYFITNNAGSKLASLQPGTGWIQWDGNQRATRSQGTWEIRNLFGSAIGMPTNDLTVESMARWTGASSATADLPLAVSLCRYTSTLRGLGSTNSVITLSLMTDTTGGSCSVPGGATASGTTVLTSGSSGCRQRSTVAQQLGVAPTQPADCSVGYLNGLVGTDIWVPVYDQSTATSVRVYGYAALHVTSVATGAPGSVTGYWTYGARQISTPDTVPTAPDLGARAVFLWDPDTWQGVRCPC